ALWRGPLRSLHQFLIAPLEETALLAGKARLIFVPHAELHYLPFAALLDSRGRFLIERYEVVETPSAAVWLALGDRRPARSTAGVLAFAPRPDALPGSRQEVATIARLAGTGAQVLTGANAREAAFRRDAHRRRGPRGGAHRGAADVARRAGDGASVLLGRVRGRWGGTMSKSAIAVVVVTLLVACLDDRTNPVGTRITPPPPVGTAIASDPIVTGAAGVRS